MFYVLVDQHFKKKQVQDYADMLYKSKTLSHLLSLYNLLPVESDPPEVEAKQNGFTI